LVRYRRQTFASLGLAPVPIRRVLLAATAAVPLSYLAAGVSTVVLLGLTGMAMADVVALKRPVVLAFGTISAWLVVPISLLVGLTEEIVFRGFLLVRLRALTGGAVGPALLTSALFGVAHYTQGLLGVVQSAAIGLVLAVLVLRTETLWPAVAAHATIDSLSLALAVVLREHL
jgi:membrane protease YdiL (CAAX protease family)